MIQIPEQVKDAPIVRMKNAVLVVTMKFTLDRFGYLYHVSSRFLVCTEMLNP